MAKSMRSKIKRKFRTELRKKIGVPHLAVQEAKIQENLKKAIESQEGSSMLQLKKLMGTASAPVATIDSSTMDVDDAAATTGSLAKTEAELLNDEAERAAAAKEKKKEAKKLATKRRKKKFVHFHTLRKKGV